MKKRKLLIPISVVLISLVVFLTYFSKDEINKNLAVKEFVPLKKEGKKKGKTMEERRRFAEERWKHEFSIQANPSTGIIPAEEKQKEIVISSDLLIQSKNSKAASNASYISRGPSNLGGRTRSLVIDRGDATSNTIIAGGVSSGVFRTTDGGASWTKVSSNNEIHNVTTIAQDPRTGFENIWYYGTGESQGNSASGNGATFLGQGIWQSTDNGITWNQMPSTASTQEANDSPFDFMYKIAVHPITGDLYAGAGGAIRRFDGSTWTVELDSGGNFFSDLAITSTGIVYAAFSGSSSSTGGVWRSENGTDTFTRIGSNTDPGFGASGRTVLAIAPSNENIVYTLFTVSGSLIEAGLWRWNDSGTGTWTDFSTRMPDEPGGDSSGNDPIAVQGGYDLVVSVKPDDENFVVIGGTNAYRASNITDFVQFTRIGGYRDNSGYSLYNLGGGAQHHPDIHALVFDPNNPDILFSGTDGGIHRADATVATVGWTNLNNNYQTYQYYNVAITPNSGSDIVIGGAQDNGTTAGGTDFGRPDLTSMSSVAGGDGVAVAISNDDTCLPFFYGFQNGRMFRDCPNGQEITPDGSDSQFVTYFYLDPSNNNALYYAGRQNLYRTTESSAVASDSWANMGTMSSATNSSGPANENITQFSVTWGAYDASTSYLLMGGSSGSLVRLDNPQGAFGLGSTVDITPAQARTDRGSVSGIAVHPNNRDIVMVTYSNYGITNIYLTNNATSATPVWTIAERNLADFSIRSVSITEVNSETRYFVGTARGLYSSTDPVNEDWEIEAPNQIGFAVVSAMAYRPADNKLLIGTHGNGMYEATLETSTLSVDDTDLLDSNILAWPNPANNVLNVVVENSLLENRLDYKVFSINGKQLKDGVLNNDKQINVSDLAQGNYILQLNSASEQKAIVFIKK
ncbi:T9SS type A sorting domain-containing protein [uncultured Aquimarina sp.]|uniref:T9SS type A sorting domain-containing protein n=1 Tax=uncultured Aquimarina sp. TaxID=575652 RepID=UPI002620EA7B|nr:T9SS type A sorting domain-containing protein [uncultured Aquimarina sp.]